MTTKIVLHSYRRCPFAIRVRMVLEEKKITYDLVEESLKAPSSELLRLHPEGKVPLLLDKGKSFYESSIITEYLEDAYPLVRLRPVEPESIAEMRLWTYWCNQHFKPDIDLFKYKWNELENTNSGEELLHRLRLHLTKLDQALLENPYLLGKDFSLADIHVFPFYRQLEKTSNYAEHFNAPQASQWLKNISERPSFIKVMQK